MKEQRGTSSGITAASLNATKEAALYFDHVIPVGLFLEVVHNHPNDTWAGVHDKFLKVLDATENDLLPPDVRSGELAELWYEIEAAGLHFLLRKKEPGSSYASNLDEMEVSVEKRLRQLIRGRSLTWIVNRPNLSQSKIGPNWLVSLRGMRLVDASSASWEQVLEFRKDCDAVAALRRLRLFAAENYSGKDRSFIQDDILARVDAYDREVKRWGLETANAVLNMALTSKTVAGGAAGSILAAALGSPGVALVSAATTVLLEAGRVAVEVSRRSLELQRSLEENPISYVVKLRDGLNG